MPLSLARAGLRALKGIARFVSGGRFNLISNSAIDFIAEDNPFSSDRAKRELGWSPGMTPDVGGRESFRWWLDRQTEGRGIEPRPS